MLYQNKTEPVESLNLKENSWVVGKDIRPTNTKIFSGIIAFIFFLTGFICVCLIYVKVPMSQIYRGFLVPVGNEISIVAKNDGYISQVNFVEGEFVKKLDAIFKIENFDNSNNIIVSSPVSGYLTVISKRIGEKVSADEAIAVIKGNKKIDKFIFTYENLETSLPDLQSEVELNVLRKTFTAKILAQYYRPEQRGIAQEPINSKLILQAQKNLNLENMPLLGMPAELVLKQQPRSLIEIFSQQIFISK